MASERAIDHAEAHMARRGTEPLMRMPRPGGAVLVGADADGLVVTVVRARSPEDGAAAAPLVRVDAVAVEVDGTGELVRLDHVEGRPQRASRL